SFPLMGRLGCRILIGHQRAMPELQQLPKEYERAWHEAGFSGPNEVTLQANCYLAETTERALAEAEHSTMRDRRIMRERLGGRSGDEEAAARSARLRADPTYADLVQRLLYGTPEAIVERLQEYQETLGITGVALNMNPGR